MSFVLNDHPNAGAIPEGTRRRVLAAAEALGYAPSPEARALRAGRSNIVLCLLPNWPITGPFGVLFQQLSSELHAVGLTMLLHQRSAGEELAHVFGALTPAAVVAVGKLTQPEVDLADRRGILVISFMGDAPGRPDVAALRQSEIGKLQARTLIHHGHTSLAYVSPADRVLDWFSGPRLQGARGESEKSGAQLVHFRMPKNNKRAVGRWLTQATTNGVTGVCAYNDEVAFALMMTASEQGLSVPGDISVVGVDDTVFGEMIRPPLTTIGFSLASEAKRLAGTITGDKDDGAKPAASTLLSLKNRGTVRTLH